MRLRRKNPPSTGLGAKHTDNPDHPPSPFYFARGYVETGFGGQAGGGGLSEWNRIMYPRHKAEGFRRYNVNVVVLLPSALLKTYRYTGSNSRCQSPRVEITCIHRRQPKKQQKALYFYISRFTYIFISSGPQPLRCSRQAKSLIFESLVILPATFSSSFFPARAQRLPSWMFAVMGPE